MGKGGGEEVEKPVAQMRTSKLVRVVGAGGWEEDGEGDGEGDMVMDEPEMDVMGAWITVTLGSMRDSRNPGPGVRRRHPGGKEGMMEAARSGRAERVADMEVWKRDWTKDCMAVPLSVESWMRFPPSSKTLRNVRKAAGSAAKACCCSGVTGLLVR